MKKFFTSSLWKTTIRTIKDSFSRYLAIIAMTGLSAMVFIGLAAGVPNMKAMLVDRVESHNFHDLKVSSYTGIREEDKKILESFEKTKVEYRSNEIFNLKDQNYSVNIYQDTKEIDKFTTVEGRLPTNKNEIALDYDYLEDHGNKIGQKISFKNKENIDKENILSQEEFEIVGYVNSVDHISNSRDSGLSASDYFAVVARDAFNKKYADTALLKIPALAGFDIRSLDYRHEESAYADKLKALLEKRPKEVEKSIKEEAEEEINKGKKEIQDAKDELAKGQKDLDQAKKDLSQAKEELDQAQVDIRDGKKKLADGEEKLKNNIAAARQEIDQGQRQIDQGQKEIYSGLKEYQASLSKFENDIQAGKDKLQEEENKLNSGKEELNKSKNLYNEAYADFQEKINRAEEDLANNKDELVKLKIALGQAEEDPNFDQDRLAQMQAEYNKGMYMLEAGQKYLTEEKNKGIEKFAGEKEKLDQASLEIENGLKKLDQAKEELTAKETSSREQLDQAKKKLDESQAQLKQKQKELNDNIARINKEEANGKAEIASQRKTLEDAEDKYQEGLVDYQNGLKDYEEGLETFEKEKAEALEKIEDTEKDIAKAEKDIEKIKVPLYEVEGKYDNQSFYSVLSQADSLRNLAIIFTSLFYLVAILVTLTTILRMIETDRLQIGTFKALGYSKGSILSKFMVYGLSAGLIGTLLGIVIGFYILMPPVVNAYLSSTDLNNNPMIFKWQLALLIFVISVVVIALTVILSVSNSLKEKAANLMRPKPPKKAVRTVFEKIKFIWSRLSFLNKISVRNIMRSKVRLFMTIFAVAGSFGLIAMAFGIYKSIVNVSDKQFEDIYKYDSQIIYNKDADDYDDFLARVKKDSDETLNIIQTSGSIKNKSDLKEEVSFVAVEDTNKLSDFIDLRSKNGKVTYKLEDGKIIINEKLAEIMGLSEGDLLEFKDPNGKFRSLEIGQIVEHYLGHKIYMTENTYKKEVDSLQEKNTLLVKFENMDEDQVGKYDSKVKGYDAYLTYLTNKSLKANLDDLSNSLKLVIVLVVALSALLTFVVLYNLTNINISERVREIATIRVLGFRPKEVASYVFKENFILSAIGMLLGIGVAKFMHNIIVYKLSPGSILFDPYLNPISYLLAAVIISVFTILVILVANRHMKKISMVDALKGVE